MWPYSATAPQPLPDNAFSATITGLSALTQRGLTPYVVLGFFPAGVYNNFTATTPTAGLPDNYAYGPSPGGPGDPNWQNLLGNWNTLVQAFFQALYDVFGDAINDWWFEVWNEPDNPNSWVPDAGSPQGALYYYCQLYQQTVQAIDGAGLPSNVHVRVGGPAIMANTFSLGGGASGTETDLQVGLGAFLKFVYSNRSTLRCDFLSIHAKGDWSEQYLPDLRAAPSQLGVISTVEAVVSQLTSPSSYNHYFDNIPVFNNEADMRVGFQVPFWDRMTSRYPAWLTALMIASDSLTSEYSSRGVQFISASDNVHPDLTGWQQSTGTMSGAYTFGQQRSLMMPASSWDAGTPQNPSCPQDLVKVPVYNFYELLRLLGDQHGVFISGQNNYYPNSSDGLFSAITVGAPSGELTHVCWVFCMYQIEVPDPDNPTTTSFTPITSLSDYVEVIGLPESWDEVNWVQFQIGPASARLSDVSSFTVAGGSTETVPAVPTGTGDWEYDVFGGQGQVTQLDVDEIDAENVRMHQELGLVQYQRKIPVNNGAWLSPKPIDFMPYSTTVFWITKYDASPAATPVAPTHVSVTRVAGRVVLSWEYPPIDPQAPGFDAGDPLYYSFFCFEVQKHGSTVSPMPTVTASGAPQWSFALRATRWVDTDGESGDQYAVRAWNASGESGPFSATVTA